jgi:polyhydroxyalkanoate synthase
MLRANDLIWSFVVNNYLLGKDPFPFDLLYWNADSTRMPAAMHSFYLRAMYQDNKLIEPGGPNGIELDGVPIDLAQVKTPAYFLSAREDHIAPWTSTYAATQIFSGPMRFVLSASGHIAGVVNPPAAGKYSHWTNAANAASAASAASAILPKTPAAWLRRAEEVPGSWWPDWAKWVARRAGPKVTARTPGAGKLKAIEDAPGSYVKVTTRN